MAMIEPPLYALHVDGVGEFAVQSDTGETCLFLFRDRDAVCAFVKSVDAESPNMAFSAIPFSSLEMIAGFLSDIQDTTTFIALDPPSSNQFTPIPVADVLRDLRSRCN